MEKAKEPTRESGENLRQVFESTADAMLIIDLDGKILEANPATCSIYGYSVEELRELSATDLIHPDNKRYYATASERVAKGQTYSTESINVCKDGTTIDVEVCLTLLAYQYQPAILATIREITERKQTKQWLQASEARWRSMADNSPDNIIEADLDGTILFINRTHPGVTPEETIGTSIYNYADGEHLEIMKATINQVLQTGEPGKYEIVISDPSGSSLWYESRIAPIKQEDQAVGLIIASTEVTERKRAEELLKESEAKYRALYEKSADGIIIADIETKAFLYANPSICHMLGYSEGELTALGVSDIHPKEDLEYVISEFEAQTRGDKTLASEIPCLRKDGTVVYADINTATALIGGRQSNIGFFRDITERQKREKAAERQQEFLLNVLESLSHPFYVIDVDDHNVVMANTAAGFGRLSETSTCYSLTHGISKPCGSAEHICPLEEVIKTRRSVVVEHIHIIENGSPRFVEVHGHPICDAEGNVVQMIEYTIDISDRIRAEEERRQLEEQIQEAKRMESLGVLAGGIAHDFNNLLTGVLGNADLALMKLSPVSPAHDPVDRIVKSARQAADLVGQMLAYSGKGKMITKPINLSEAVEEMTYAIEDSIENNAAVEYNLASDLPMIEADPSQIRQAIQNLVNNALEALGDEGGTITVTTGVVECGPGFDCLPEPRFGAEPEEGTYVYLRVEDDGCGMDEEIQEKIFDPFFSTKFTGRGLGLPAVMGIAQGHEGAVSVKSEPGKGTTVMVLFPASEQPAAGQ